MPSKKRTRNESSGIDSLQTQSDIASPTNELNTEDMTIDNSDYFTNDAKKTIYTFLEHYPEFSNILQQGNNLDIESYIIQQEERSLILQAFKAILFKNDAKNIEPSTILAIQNLFKGSAEQVDDVSTVTYHSESDLDYTSPSSSQFSESPYKGEVDRSTRSDGRVPAILSAKEVKPYVMEMMGGFEFDIRNDEVYVSDSAEIRRPNKVKGNLGNIAGDHVIPFALFTRDIESKVKGQEVSAAINALALIFGGIQVEGVDYYQYIIEKASQYTAMHGTEGIGFKEKIAAFQFLRSEFIPYVTAIWNQRVGTAFKSTKTQVERGKEGAMVREMLNHLVNMDINEKNSEQANIENFIKVIDYKPIEDVGHVQLLGHRNNDIQELSQVIGDVTETYCYIYQVDAIRQADVTKKLVIELLQQHNWINYYYKHPEYLKNHLKPTSSNPTEGFRDGLIDHICSIIAHQQSFLMADAQSVSSDSSFAEKNSNQDINTEYYTEDQIATLLNHYLPDDQLYYVAPQTQFEHNDLLQGNLEAAIAAAKEGRIAVMHINLHNNHWVGIIIRAQENGAIEVIYVDPMGGRVENEKNAKLFMQTITGLTVGNVNIIDLGTQNFNQQQNGIDCGPFTVDNLVRLAQAGNQLDNRDAEDIIKMLFQPKDGSATNLREAHNIVFNPHHEAPIGLVDNMNHNSTNSNAMSIQSVLEIGAEITLDVLGSTSI